MTRERPERMSKSDAEFMRNLIRTDPAYRDVVEVNRRFYFFTRDAMFSISAKRDPWWKRLLKRARDFWTRVPR